MSRAASQYTSGTLKPLMSIPMICSAACRASSALRASLIPPALPRPPTGTWAFTASGPIFSNAAAASSALRATTPGGIGMPSDARTSLAWYSRSFKSAITVLAQAQPPIVAAHPMPLRILEVGFTEQLKPDTSADAVGGRVIDGWKGVDRRMSVGISSELNGMRHGSGRNAAPLMLGQDSPSHLVDL